MKKQLSNLKGNYFLEFKIIAFLEIIRKTKKFVGLVEFMIFTKSSLKKLLEEDEMQKINIYDFFVDECDLQDYDIRNIINGPTKRKRGLVIECNNSIIVISTENQEYLKLTKKKWTEIVKRNNIFIRKTERIFLYKYLCELDLEPNILDHREFLKIIKEIETRIIHDSKDPKDYIRIPDREKLIIHYEDIFIEIGIENDLLTIFDKNKNQKTTVEFNDEGRDVKYVVN